MTPPPAPETSDDDAPQGDPGNTVRERIAFHESSPACAECHAAMDNIGFAFEHYNPRGRYITEYGDGNVIDATGSLNILGVTGEWSSLNELATILSESESVANCLSLHLTRAAFATKGPNPNSCKTIGNVSNTNQSINELILAPIADQRFVLKPKETAE